MPGRKKAGDTAPEPRRNGWHPVGRARRSGGSGGAQGAKSEVDGGRRKPEEMGQVLLAKAILVVGEAFVQKMTPNEFDFFHGKLVYFR